MPDERGIICTDLDGTLVATDTLWESFIVLLRTRPFLCLMLPFWLFRGRAVLKRELCKRARPRAALLPYRKSVLNLLQQARAAGWKICLVTAADTHVAREVAAYVGLFDEVIASDGKNNMKAQLKVDAIRRRWKDQKFDYIGDARADIPVWQAAGRAYVVNPSARLRNRILSICPIESSFDDFPATRKDVFQALRIHQWVKNLLLFVPIILAHEVADASRLIQTGIGAIAFSLMASALYVVNDLLDLESDRRHPHKQKRPFAAGRLSIVGGLVLSAGAGTAAVLLAGAFLPAAFALLLLGYAALTILYSFYLKEKLMVDVITLAGFYAYRIVAGGVAAQVVISPWLLAFSIFFFLSIAFIKRYSEIEAVGPDESGRIPGRGYYVKDLDMIRSMGPVAGYVAVLVLALYVSSDVVSNLYPRPIWLWPICVCLLYWITRMWFLAHRHQMPHDPVMFAIRDRISHLCGLSVILLLVLASL